MKSAETVARARVSADRAALVDSIYQELVQKLSGSDRAMGDRGSVRAAATGESSVSAIVPRVLDAAPLMPPSEALHLAHEIAARLHGLGPLDTLLADSDVTEVMVNGAGPVWVERDGKVICSSVEIDDASLAALIERIVGPLGLRADRSAPLVDARLPDGSRVNIVVPPLAVDGPYVTVRRFAPTPLLLDAFAGPETAARLAQAVRDRRNIIVSGGTGAGKTSLLNALAAFIPAGHRVITIEDTAELQLPGDHVVRLEARPGNAEGVGAVSIRELVRNALRMRPDRIIVGEVRGGEALDMVQAMNTGHDGSLSSCHASSAADALRRLETMVMQANTELSLAAVRDHLRAAVDMIVQVSRGADGQRSIVDVVGVDESGLHPVGVAQPGSR